MLRVSTSRAFPRLRDSTWISQRLNNSPNSRAKGSQQLYLSVLVRKLDELIELTSGMPRIIRLPTFSTPSFDLLRVPVSPSLTQL
jgi:hypothetical protein